MTYSPPDLALIGRASTGKDTVADYLVANHGYTRLAFADPLRDLAAFVDPVVGVVDRPHGPDLDHYTDALARVGYRETKDRFPEARRFLDRLGRGVREVLGADVWVEALAARLEAVDGPVVVTDCRFPNEARLLAVEYDFLTLRLTRKAAPVLDLPSEVALDDYETDLAFANDGSLDLLHAYLDALALDPAVLEAAP